jgi:hypothetical protein
MVMVATNFCLPLQAYVFALIELSPKLSYAVHMSPWMRVRTYGSPPRRFAGSSPSHPLKPMLPNT